VARLGKGEVEALRHLEGKLATFGESSPPVLESFATDLRSVLGAPRGAAYSWELGEEGPTLETAYFSGFHLMRAEMAGMLDRWFRSTDGQWALFNPLAPEPFQRNELMNVGTYTQLLESGGGQDVDIYRLPLTDEARVRLLDDIARGEEFHRRAGILHHHQLRVLACDGPVLLAWVGILTDAPVTPRQRRLFRRLVRPLVFRLRLEARMRSAPIHRAGLELALEALCQPAYLVSRSGTIVHANELGRRAMESSSGTVAGAVAGAIDGEPGYDVGSLALRGASGGFLVVARPGSSGDPAAAEARLRQVAAHFALTRRQVDVLRGLLRGHSNRRIALALGCSERTVEVHVRKLFAKMDATSRAEVIVRALS
jgi:DNA-binding CsgD family transcriptional regulator/PAS domain-containing protein